MNVLEAAIAAIIGAVVGYMLGKRGVSTAGGRRNLKIHVKKEGDGSYTSKTTPKKQPIRGFDVVYWEVNDQGSNALPAGSIVKLKFTNGNPLADSEPNDGKKRTIFSLVSFGQEQRSFPYKVYYNAGGDDILLEDPELIIEN